jgi:hypothetical protein
MAGILPSYEYIYEHIYNDLVQDFKQNKNKNNLVSKMINYCGLETTTNIDVYMLKKKMDINFAKDVKCTYCYLTITPTDYGCDLREILFNRDEQLIENGQDLLDIFNRKQIDKVFHIMTDIDDTLYPHSGVGSIAGSDKSWKNKEPYPGIKKFYEEFYLTIPEYCRYSTILSATPGCLKTKKLINPIYKDILGEFSFIHGFNNKYKNLQPVSILGNLVGLKKNETREPSSLHKELGMKKFERFKQYIQIFPEYKIIFIGDNGQGDVIAGMNMLLENPKVMVFIHTISENGKSYLETPSVDGVPTTKIIFYKNYFHLTLELYKKAIFNQSACEKIQENMKDTIENSTYAKTYEHLYKNVFKNYFENIHFFVRKYNEKYLKYKYKYLQLKNKYIL